MTIRQANSKLPLTRLRPNPVHSIRNAPGFSVSSQRMGADKRDGCSGSAACCSPTVLSMSSRPNSSSSISRRSVAAIFASPQKSASGWWKPFGMTASCRVALTTLLERSCTRSA